MPGIDVSAWAETIVRLLALETFRLDLIYSVDKMRQAYGEVTTYFLPNQKREKLFAEDVESRLREMKVDLGTGSGVRWRLDTWAPTGDCMENHRGGGNLRYLLDVSTGQHM
jgi:hypothetical protein